MVNINANRSFQQCMIPADPMVRNLAVSLAREYPGEFHLSQCIPLFGFVRNEVAYISDPRNMEYFALPQETIEQRGGDCDDKAILLVNLILAIGGYARIVVAMPADGKGHAWVDIKLEGDQHQVREQVGFLRNTYRQRGVSLGLCGIRAARGSFWLAADPTNESFIGQVDNLVQANYLEPMGSEERVFPKSTEVYYFYP